MSNAVERIIARLKKGEKTRILGFGSSNTERFLPGSHWLDCLDLALRKHGRIVTMINSGISGNTSRELLNRFEADAAFYQPHLALITVGGNDCNPERNLSLADFEENLHELYRRFKELGTEVVFQTYYAPYVQDCMPERYKAFLEYSDIVRKVAAATGAGLIDHLARWMPFRDKYLDKYLPLMRDGFHLNERGNKVFGVDLARHFDAALTAGDYDYWGDALYIQRLMDELEKSNGKS